MHSATQEHTCMARSYFSTLSRTYSVDPRRRIVSSISDRTASTESNERNGGCGGSVQRNEVAARENAVQSRTRQRRKQDVEKRPRGMERGRCCAVQRLQRESAARTRALVRIVDRALGLQHDVQQRGQKHLHKLVVELRHQLIQRLANRSQLFDAHPRIARRQQLIGALRQREGGEGGGGIQSRVQKRGASRPRAKRMQIWVERDQSNNQRRDTVERKDRAKRTRAAYRAEVVRGLLLRLHCWSWALLF
jgi:hypothetical protein